MTMLTRCTNCATAFRITPEQLSTKHGKVRCGSCGHIFIAAEQVVWADEQPSSTIDTKSIASADQAGSGIPSTSVADDPRSAPDSPPDELAVKASTEAEVTDSAPISGSAPKAKARAAVLDAAPAMRQYRWASMVGALVAALVLILQSAYFYRDDIAARYPPSKPWLERMCAKLACRFETPRDAQSISIESHDLQADPRNKNLLVLVALLRNRAAFDQESPHIELTLTDAQDSPLARRVFSPREYGPAKRMASGTETQVRVLLDASLLKASGYRIYAFYP